MIESNRVDGVQLKEDPPCSPYNNPVFQLKLRTHPLAGTLAFQLAAVIVRYVWSIRLCRLFCNLWYSDQAPNSSGALYFALPYTALLPSITMTALAIFHSIEFCFSHVK